MPIRFNLRIKLLLGFLLLTLLLAGVSILSIQSITAISGSFSRASQETLPLFSSTSRIINLWYQVVVHTQKYALLQEREHRHHAESFLEDLRSEIGKFERAARTDHERVVAQQLRDSFAVLERTSERFISDIASLPQAQSFEEEKKRDKLVGQRISALLETQVAISNLLEAQSLANNQINAIASQIAADAAETRSFIVLITVLAGVVALVLSFLISITLTRPLRTLTRTVGEIAQGDLSQRVHIDSGDEIGKLAASFNDMASQLQASYEGLEEKVREKTQELSLNLKELENTKKAMLNILEDERRLDEMFKEERDRARAIVTSIGEGVFVVDKNYKVLLSNPKAGEFLDLTPQEALGKDVRKTFMLVKDGKVVPDAERPLHKTLTTGETITLNLSDNASFRTLSGKEFPVLLTISPLRGDGVTGAVIVFRDITNLKRADQALRHEKESVERKVEERTRELEEAEVQLEASIQSLNVGFMMTDTEHNILTINGAALLILTRNKAESIQLLESLKKHPPHLKGKENMGYVEEILKGSYDLRARIDQCLSEKKPIQDKSVSFSGRFLHVFISPIIRFKGKFEVIGTVVLIEDVTEVKILERAKDEFFSIASHELRTPLTAIRGNTALIMNFYADKLPDPNLKEMVNDIHESSVRLIEIVNDFLDVSRLELGKIEFTKESLDLSGIVNNVLKEQESTASDKKLYLRLETRGSIPLVVGDPDRVKQILINLVGNALKFTREGGVSVELSPSTEGFVEIAVSDTGRGISKENQKLLFRKFQQAEENLLTRDATQGTGLGLYISKLLVEGMGGKIYLKESEEGKGSTFVFTLPVQEERAGNGQGLLHLPIGAGPANKMGY